MFMPSLCVIVCLSATNNMMKCKDVRDFFNATSTHLAMILCIISLELENSLHSPRKVTTKWVRGLWQRLCHCHMCNCQNEVRATRHPATMSPTLQTVVSSALEAVGEVGGLVAVEEIIVANINMMVWTTSLF